MSLVKKLYSLVPVLCWNKKSSDCACADCKCADCKCDGRFYGLKWDCATVGITRQSCACKKEDACCCS